MIYRSGLLYKLRSFYIKSLSWEYWPMWLVYFPASMYYIYLSIKAKSFFFFSASNPSIETGGMFFESKWKIFELIPKEFYPSSVFVNVKDNLYDISANMQGAGISFPIIAKPDRGERGWAVKKIENETELETYIRSVRVPFIIQEYIDYPLELSIFYYRHPLHKKGIITSVTFKKLLTVVGDGSSTIEELIMMDHRAFLQYPKLKTDPKLDLKKVLQKDEHQVLVPYGNHVRGAMFLNYNHIIDNELEQVIDTISQDINGFFFGRFDLKCNSIEELKSGQKLSVLELNGAGAEPAHIYDPGFSYLTAQKVLVTHYRMMYDAAIENKKQGAAFMTFQDFRSLRKAEKLYKLNVNMN